MPSANFGGCVSDKYGYCLDPTTGCVEPVEPSLVAVISREESFNLSRFSSDDDE